MKKAIFIIAVLFSACSKDYSCEECFVAAQIPPVQLPQPTQREIDINKEKKDSLAKNQMLEEKGLRFILTPSVDSSIAHVWLKLYKGYDSTGTRLLPMVPIIKHNYNNYSVQSEWLTDSTEFTLTVEYDRAVLGGKFSLRAVGITNTYTSKYFTASGSLNATAAGTVRDCIRIKKGIIKYSFFTLQ